MVDQLMIDRVAAAIDGTDVHFQMELTKLVDGVSTYTLTMDSKTEEFEDTDDLYARVREIKQRKQAEAVIAALSPSPAPPLRVTDDLLEQLRSTRICSVCDGDGCKSDGRACVGCDGAGHVLQYGSIGMGAADEIEQLQMDVAIFNSHRHELLEQIDVGQPSPAPASLAAPRKWVIDHTAGRPILTLDGCSVIEAEDADYLMGLIHRDQSPEPLLEVPEGWQLVPKIPTVEQECAPDFDDCRTPDAAKAIYQAMLAAAPLSPLDIVTVQVLQEHPLKMAVTSDWLKDKIEADGEVAVETGSPSEGDLAITDNLLPCPFCGGKADFLSVFAHKYEADYGDRWRVKCQGDCGNCGEVKSGKDDAARAWNRRAPSPRTEGGMHHDL